MSVKFIDGKGNLESPIMFIGEAPGEEEDLEGEPFVGRSGKLLTKMIEYMGYQREEVYITNVVKVRPANNRTPTDEELLSWKPLLLREIEVIKPKVIITLGSSSAKTLINLKAKISKIRGKTFGYEFEVDEVKNCSIIPTYHPAYCLRNPSAKDLVKDDLKRALELLKDVYV